MGHSIDGLARNLEDLQRLVRELTQCGVSICFIKENMTSQTDDINPMQTLMLQMLGAFAQFERALIRERQRDGIALARKGGHFLERLQGA